MPPHRPSLVVSLVCSLAARACRHGRYLLEQQVAGDKEQLQAACTAAAQLSAAVLEQLLAECRSLPDAGDSMLLQSCYQAASMLADSCNAAAKLEPCLVHSAAATLS
jgi:hypothetical protein